MSDDINKRAEELAQRIVERVIAMRLPEGTDAMADRLLQRLEEGRREIVRETVVEVFAKMGIDVANVNETSALKSNLQFLHGAHTSAKQIKRVAINTGFGALFGLLLAIFGIGWHVWSGVGK